MKKSLYLLFFLSMFTSCTSSPQEPKSSGTPLPTIPVKVLSDNELLDLVQKDAIKYFWDYANPISKLARERYHTEIQILNRI